MAVVGLIVPLAFGCNINKTFPPDANEAPTIVLFGSLVRQTGASEYEIRQRLNTDLGLNAFFLVTDPNSSDTLTISSTALTGSITGISVNALPNAIVRQDSSEPVRLAITGTFETAGEETLIITLSDGVNSAIQFTLRIFSIETNIVPQSVNGPATFPTVNASGNLESRQQTVATAFSLVFSVTGVDTTGPLSVDFELDLPTTRLSYPNATNLIDVGVSIVNTPVSVNHQGTFTLNANPPAVDVNAFPNAVRPGRIVVDMTVREASPSTATRLVKLVIVVADDLNALQLNFNLASSLPQPITQLNSPGEVAFEVSIDDFDTTQAGMVLPFFGTGDPGTLNMVVTLDAAFTAQTYGSNPATRLADIPLTLDLQPLPISANPNSSVTIGLGTNFTFTLRADGRMPQPSALDGNPPGRFKLNVTVFDQNGSETIAIVVNVAQPPRLADVELIASGTWQQVGGIFDPTFQGWRNSTFVSFTTVFSTALPSTLNFIVPRTLVGGTPEFKKTQMRLVLDTTRSSPGFTTLQNTGLEFRGATAGTTELSATGSGTDNTIEIGLSGKPKFSGDLFFELEAWGEDASGQRIGSQRRATVYFRIFDTPPAFVYDERLYSGLNTVFSVDNGAGAEIQSWIGGSEAGVARIDHIVDSFLRDPIRFQQTIPAAVTGGPTPPTSILKLVGGQRPTLTGRWTSISANGMELTNANANWPIDYWKNVAIQPNQGDARKFRIVRNTTDTIFLDVDVSDFVTAALDNSASSYITLGRVADEGVWAAEPTYPVTVGASTNLTEFELDGSLVGAPDDALVGYTLIPIIDATDNATVSTAEREEYLIVRSVSNRVYVTGNLTPVLTNLTGENYMLIGRNPVTMAALFDTALNDDGAGVLICTDAERDNPGTWTPMAFSPALSTLDDPVVVDVHIDNTADSTSPGFVMIALVRETSGAKRLKTYRYRSVDSALGTASTSDSSTTVTMTSGIVEGLQAGDFVRFDDDVRRVISVDTGANTFVVNANPSATATTVGVFRYTFVGDTNHHQNLIVYEGQWTAVDPAGSPTTLTDSSQVWADGELDGFVVIPDISQPTQFDTIDSTTAPTALDGSTITVSAPPTLDGVTDGSNDTPRDYYRILGTPAAFEPDGVVAVSRMAFQRAADDKGPQTGWMLVTFRQPNTTETLRHQLYRTSYDRDEDGIQTEWSVFWIPVDGAFILSRELVTDFVFIPRGGLRTADEWYIGVGEGVPVIYEFEPENDDRSKGKLNKLANFPRLTQNAGTGAILSFGPVPGNSELVWVGADNGNLYLSTLDTLVQRRDELPVDFVNSSLLSGIRSVSFASASYGVVITDDRFCRFGGRDEQINPGVYVRDVRSPNPGAVSSVVLNGFGHPPINFNMSTSITLPTIEDALFSRSRSWHLYLDSGDRSIVTLAGNRLNWQPDYDPFIFDNSPYDPQNPNGFRYNLYAGGRAVLDGIGNPGTVDTAQFSDIVTANSANFALIEIGDYVEISGLTVRVIAKPVGNQLQISRLYPHALTSVEMYRVPPFAIDPSITFTMTAGNSTVTASSNISGILRPGDLIQLGTEGFEIESVGANTFVVSGTPATSFTSGDFTGGSPNPPAYKHPPFVLSGTVQVNTGNLDTVVGTGTAFLTELSVGDYIKVGTETRLITAIATNTSLTVGTAFSVNVRPGTVAKNMMRPPTFTLRLTTLTHGSGPTPQSDPPRIIEAGGGDNVDENGIFLPNARTIQKADFSGPWGVPRGWAVQSSSNFYPNGQPAGWVHSSMAPTPTINVDVVYLREFIVEVNGFSVGANAQITLPAGTTMDPFRVGDELVFTDIDTAGFAVNVAQATANAPIRVTNVAGTVITTDLDSTGFGTFNSGNVSLARLTSRQNRRLVRRFSDSHDNPLTAGLFGATPDNGFLIVDSDAHFTGAQGDLGNIDTSLYSPVIDASVNEDSIATISFRFRRYNLGGTARLEARKWTVPFSSSDPGVVSASSARWGNFRVVREFNARNDPADGWEYVSVPVNFDQAPFDNLADGDDVWEITDTDGAAGGANANPAYSAKYVQFRLRFVEATWAGWWMIDDVLITP